MQELRTGTAEIVRPIRTIVRLAVLQATGDRPTDEEALEMIAEADLDGDGRSEDEDIESLGLIFSVVNYDEFVLIMSNNMSPRK